MRSVPYPSHRKQQGLFLAISGAPADPGALSRVGLFVLYVSSPHGSRRSRPRALFWKGEAWTRRRPEMLPRAFVYHARFWCCEAKVGDVLTLSACAGDGTAASDIRPFCRTVPRSGHNCSTDNNAAIFERWLRRASVQVCNVSWDERHFRQMEQWRKALLEEGIVENVGRSSQRDCIRLDEITGRAA